VKALILALFAGASAAAPWEAKPFGVLLVGGSGSSAGGKGLASLRDGLKGKFPVEFAFGLGDFKEIQRGIDRLSALKVKKLVVVPLVLASESSAVEETKYVLGMRKDPDPAFFKQSGAGYTNVRRAQTKLAVVMSSALDDHPLVSDILAARAKELSEKPEREKLVLIGRGAADDAENEVAARHLSTLARRVKDKVKFSEAHAFLLREDAEPKARAKAHKELRKTVGILSRSGKVIVVPHLLATDGTERSIRKLLDGLFYAFNGKGLMPDARLAQWVEDKAREAAELPDMRQHKDAGRPIPPPERKRLLQMDLGRAADGSKGTQGKGKATLKPIGEYR
jgi:sirohydrochlorin cobaltochelatase